MGEIVSAFARWTPGRTSPTDRMGCWMLDLGYSYQECVEKSDKVLWTLDDLLLEGAQLDLDRPSMPESMARVDALDFLAEDERRQLNQIAGNSYMNLLAQMEGAIIASSIKHAQTELSGEPEAARALVRVAEEEFKHRRLFERYCRAFGNAFPGECETLVVAAELSSALSSRGSMVAVLVTLHLELATQWHFGECFMGDGKADPLFRRILEAHWLDECQHVKIDTLELARAAAVMSDGAIDGAIYDYLEIIETIAQIVVAQADLDVRSLASVAQRTFSDEEQVKLIESRTEVYRGLFIVSGMLNPHFLEAVRRFYPDGCQVIDERAKATAKLSGEL